MGILTNYFPGVEKLHHEVKKIHKFFDPCIDVIKEAWAMLKGKSVQNDPSKKKDHDKKQKEINGEKVEARKNLDKYEKDSKEKDGDKKEFCNKTKKLLKKVYETAVDDLFEKKSKNEKSSFLKEQENNTPTNYCRYPTQSSKALKKIGDEFESKENYLEICMTIRQTGDCSKFQPDNEGAWNFIKKTLKYGIFIKNGASCIVDLLKKGGKHEAKGIPENKQISALANDALGKWEFVKIAFQEFGSLILHILSFGIWGVLRAAWNLLKLSGDIIKLAAVAATEFPYHIGKLVGLVLKIIKSLSFGRRRRK